MYNIYYSNSNEYVQRGCTWNGESKIEFREMYEK